MPRHSAPCAATRKSCGTPAGWRAGGRCPKCRAAHNAEVNRYRGLRPAQRETALTALREGASPKEAAQQAGVTLKSLRGSSSRDGELHLALAGQPQPLQHLARQGDFLAALTYTVGNFADAAQRVSLDPTTVRQWRQGDPLYAAAEDAVTRWIAITAVEARGDGRKRRGKIDDASLERAADLLEAGSTIGEAAREIGVTGQGLRVASARHARLAAALPPRVPRAVPGRTSGLTADVEKQLRALWADPGTSVASIALRFHVDPRTVGSWRKSLGLPPRKTRATELNSRPAPG